MNTIAARVYLFTYIATSSSVIIFASFAAYIYHSSSCPRTDADAFVSIEVMCYLLRLSESLISQTEGVLFSSDILISNFAVSGRGNGPASIQAHMFPVPIRR